MADDPNDQVDAMLQGNEDQPDASQAQNDGQGTDSIQDDIRPLEQQSPEEVEFNKLSGSAQDRFKKAWERARVAEEALAQRNDTPAYVPPAPNTLQSPDQQNAITALENAGLASDRKVDEKINGVLWKLQQDRLEQKYDGSQSEPQYVREEVEDFISKHPQYRGYDAEDVFKYKMFPDEFSNITRQKTGSATGHTQTLRPTKASVQQNSLTPESIEERLKQPDGQQWYSEHQDEINNVLSKMQPQ